MKETKLYFETGYLLDSSYERAAQNQDTIAKMVPVFQTVWDDLGTQFTKATLKVVGREFRRSELLAYLIMHPGLFSCSHPFLININRFLPFDSSSSMQNMKFAELVYHELLHIFLDDNYGDRLDPKSKLAFPLIEKFAKEGDIVLAHLHLYAIQESVFKTGGWENVWSWIVENAKSAHSPGYKKAIDIIQDVGSTPFLEELKQT